MKSILSWVVVLCALLAVSLRAHHSLASEYDTRHEGTLSGVVLKVVLANPHGALHVEVRNSDGTKTEWVLTTGSSSALQSLGFDQKFVKAGDPVKVTYYASRSGKPVGFLRRITLADRRELEFEAR
jgi:hypothetical protein